MPVGLCRIRTAEEVLLTCWPPAPLDRKVSYFNVVRFNHHGAVVRYFRNDLDQRKRGVPAT